MIIALLVKRNEAQDHPVLVQLHNTARASRFYCLPGSNRLCGLNDALIRKGSVLGRLCG